MSGPAPVHLVIDDLFFRAKVEATAAALEVPVRLVDDPATLADRLQGGSGGTVLVDLNHPADPIAAIRTLKSAAPSVRVIAFGSHVDGERLKAAREAGADRVLARSAFTERLPELLGP